MILEGGFNPKPCQQFFNPKLQKNQQGNLSQVNNNLQQPEMFIAGL